MLDVAAYKCHILGEIECQTTVRKITLTDQKTKVTIMFKFIKRLFVWWEDSTIGTQWHTFVSGQKVGVDENGNTYYRGQNKRPLSASMPERRWVV